MNQDTTGPKGFVCAYRSYRNQSAPPSFEDIRVKLFSDKSIELTILELRMKSTSTDPEVIKQTKELKDTLPALSPSTTAWERGDLNSVKEHTGIIVIDIDDIRRENLEDIKDVIFSDGLCFLVGISPSGSGLKAAYKVDPVPTSVDDHRDAYLRLVQYVDSVVKPHSENCYADTQAKNAERLCYQSYDTNQRLRPENEIKPVQWQELPRHPDSDGVLDVDGHPVDPITKRLGAPKYMDSAVVVPADDDALPPGQMQDIDLCPLDRIQMGERRQVINSLVFHGYVNMLWPLEYCRSEAYALIETHMEQPAIDLFTRDDVDRIVDYVEKETVDERQKTIARLEQRSKDLRRNAIFRGNSAHDTVKELIPDPVDHFGLDIEVLQELNDRGNAQRFIHDNGVFVTWSPGSADKGVTWNWYDDQEKIWVVDTAYVGGRVSMHIFESLDNMFKVVDGQSIWTYQTLKKECEKHNITFEWDSKKETVMFDGDVDALPKPDREKIESLATYYSRRMAKRNLINKWKFACSKGTSRGQIGMSHIDTSHTSALMYDGHWDDKEGYGNTQAGVINFKSGACSDTPKNIYDYHTKKFGFTAINDLLTEPDDVIAPKYMKFLKRVQPNPEHRDFLLSCSGYALTGIADQRFLIIHAGTGSNGKSVQMDIWRRIYGEGRAGYAFNASWTTFAPITQAEGATPQRALFAGVRMINVSEWPDNERIDTTFLKSFTGNDDVMTARALYGSPFEFRPQALIQISTNHKPVISDSGEGMWTRIKLLTWDVVIPKQEQNPALTQELIKEEGDRIFTLYVKYAMRYLQTRTVEVPKSVNENVQQYQKEQDVMASFFEENIEVISGQLTATSDLYDAYTTRTNSRIHNLTFAKKFKDYARRYNNSQGNQVKINYLKASGQGRPARYENVKLRPADDIGSSTTKTRDTNPTRFPRKSTYVGPVDTLPTEMVS